MRGAFLFLVVAALCACSGASSSPPERGATERRDATTSTTAPAEKREQPLVVIKNAGGEHRFRVELATTPRERARGLMFREQMDADAGMLFLFDRAEVQSFWMKNTKIPLDMLFLDEQGVIVGIVENAEPLSLTSRSVGLPSRYVLELNGGTCRRLGIEAGQRALFLGVPGHPAKSAGPTR